MNLLAGADTKGNATWGQAAFAQSLNNGITAGAAIFIPQGAHATLSAALKKAFDEKGIILKAVASTDFKGHGVGQAIVIKDFKFKDADISVRAGASTLKEGDLTLSLEKPRWSLDVGAQKSFTGGKSGKAGAQFAFGGKKAAVFMKVEKALSGSREALPAFFAIRVLSSRAHAS